MADNVTNFGAILNSLVKDHNLILNVFHSRYGDGEIAFLCMGEERAERIIDAFTGGDSEYERITKYFMDGAWFPIVYGEHTIDALDKLLEFVGKDFIKKDVGLWVRAVDRACSDFAYTTGIAPLTPNHVTYMVAW